MKPFSDEQLRVHVMAIDRRRDLGSVKNALDDDCFLDHLYRVLLPAWGIGVRESRLVDEKDFFETLRGYSTMIASLEKVTIDGAEKDFQTALNILSLLLENLSLVENKARVVAFTKTLHHILPDLVPPMDRKFTGRFFGWYTEFQDAQQWLLQDGFAAFRQIALAVNPSQYVGEDWRTSRTKVMDNAIVGYCIHEKLPFPSSDWSKKKSDQVLDS